MMSKKFAVRVIAAILALLIFGGIFVMVIQIFASGACFKCLTPTKLSLNGLGDNFNIATIIVFAISLLALVAFIILYIIKRRKDEENNEK